MGIDTGRRAGKFAAIESLDEGVTGMANREFLIFVLKALVWPVAVLAIGLAQVPFWLAVAGG